MTTSLQSQVTTAISASAAEPGGLAEADSLGEQVLANSQLTTLHFEV